MTAEQNRRRRPRSNLKLSRAFDKPVLRCRREPLLALDPVSIPAERISPGHAVQQIEFTLTRQPAKRAVADFIALLIKLARLEVITHQGDHLRAHVITVQRMHIQSIKKM